MYMKSCDVQYAQRGFCKFQEAPRLKVIADKILLQIRPRNPANGKFSPLRLKIYDRKHFPHLQLYF